MMRTILAVAAVATLMACAPTRMVSAANEPRVLMMTEDFDKDTVPRNSRVNKRVLAALQEEFDQSGIKIYDEAALTLDFGAQGRQRRPDAELIDVARSTRQVDVLALYSIYASAEPLDYMTKVRVRISGRMFDVNSGRVLGNFESELPRPSPAPKDCSRECLLESVGKDAKAIAQNLGEALQMKLNHIVGGGGSGNSEARRDGGGSGGGQAGGAEGYVVEYKVTMDGFSAREMDDLEDLMVQKFRGYRSHRSIDTQSKRRTYIYESASDSTALERNLRRSLDHLSLQGQVQFSNNAYVITKIGLRKPVRESSGDRW
ncbi:MAG: hypothetical protein EPN20_09840 [Magnetospirillum sp.]|nr:MAG: hypothetical protein EPN20_09840 [Magnetospirillum sp.]